MALVEQFIWSERYRPQTIDEVILPDRIKKIFRGYVDRDGKLPHMLLKGPKGAGKTTIALAACRELGADTMVRNGSMSNMDLLRTDLTKFASTMSFKKSVRKYAILDEGDNLGRGVDEALRAFIQEYAHNCSFIFTANYPDKMLPELRGRLTEIDFTIQKDEKRDMMRAMYVRITEILEKEGVEYDRNAVAELMKRHAPDWRRCIDECQTFAAQNDGKIDAGILAVGLVDEEIDVLFQIIKDGNFDKLRKWVGQNADLQPQIIFRALFDKMHKYLVPASVAFIIVKLADYQYKSAFVADQEINTLACLVEVTAEAEFK